MSNKEQVNESVAGSEVIAPAGIEPVEVSTAQAFSLKTQEGYFIELGLPDLSLAYTCSGKFRVDICGAIFSDNGFMVEGGYHIPRPSQRIKIGRTGMIERFAPDGLWHPCGLIRVVSFAHPEKLTRFMGSNLLLSTNASGPAMPVQR